MTGAKGNKILDFGSGVGVCSEDTEVFLGGLVWGLGVASVDCAVRGWVVRREGNGQWHGGRRMLCPVE